MRTRKELLLVMLDHIKWIGTYAKGLCSLNNRLFESKIISLKEREIIEDYLSTRLPLPMRNGYCWQAGEIKPRIEFLNELIKNYTETNNQINL
jgi:hypothetical protein